AFQLSRRSPSGAPLGPQKNRIRPARAGIAVSDRGGAIRRLAVFARGIQHELCLPRSPVPSLLGTCSRAPSRDFYRSRRARLLADPPFFELAVSGRRRRQMKYAGVGTGLAPP